MLEEQLRLLKEVLSIRGLDLHVFRPPYQDIVQFDRGLRRMIFRDADYRSIKAYFDSLLPGSLHSFQDFFGLHYFAYQAVIDEAVCLLLVGPYRQTSVDELIENRFHHCVLSNQQKEEIRHRFLSIKQIEEDFVVRDILLKVYAYLFGTKHVDIVMDEMQAPNHVNIPLLIPEDNSEQILATERQYLMEKKILDAISQEDYQTAIQMQSLFHTENNAKLRYRKNLWAEKAAVLTFDALARTAVQHAHMHPSHVESISIRSFLSVEAAQTTGELVNLVDEMIKDYCALVRDHSVSGYSEMIGKAINHIDFHLRDRLTLADIARQLKVCRTYLSSQFSKETGEQLTSYINRKRMEEAIKILPRRELSIQQIAEAVGFSDYNYFTRVFKRAMGMSPSQYRSRSADWQEYKFTNKTLC